MTDLKITQLPAGTPPVGVELVEMVQGGQNVSITAAQFSKLASTYIPPPPALSSDGMDGDPGEPGAPGLPGLNASALIQQRGATWNNGLSAIVVPMIDVPIVIAEDCSIQDVTILTEGGTGSCSIDIWSTPFGAYPPTVSNTIISGSSYPAIVSGVAYRDTTLAGFSNTTLSKGSTVVFHLRSSSVFSSIVILMSLKRTGALADNGYTNAQAIAAVAGALANTGNVAFTYAAGAISANYVPPSPGSSVTANGYQAFTGGLLMQWGSVTATVGLNPVDIAVTFPIAFPTGVFVIVCSANRNVANQGQAVDGSNFVSNITTTGCTITVDNGTSNYTGYWFAIGH